MKKRKITDEELKQAAERVRNAMLDTLDELPQEPHRFSPEFEARMAELIKAQARKKARKQKILYFLCRAAVVFLAVLLAAGLWLSVDTRARAAVSRWFREISPDRTTYQFVGEVSDKELPQYALSWLPEGYEEADRYGGSQTQNMEYINQTSGDYIVFTCRGADNQTSIDLMNTERSVLIVDIAGTTGYYYEPQNTGDANTLLWISDGSLTSFSISSHLPLDDILQMAESLRIIGK